MKILFICFFSLISGTTSGVLNAQKAQDTLLIRQWIDSAWDDQVQDPVIRLRLAKSALYASQPGYYFGILNAYQVLGDIAFNNGQLDSAQHYYRIALAMSLDADDLLETGHNYTSLTSILMEAGERDTALQYSLLAIDAFRKTNDSSSLCDILLRSGNIHNTMGHHDLAIHSYMESIRICEAIGNNNYVGYNFGAIASVHDKQGQFQKAEEYFFKALDQFRDSEDIYGQMSVWNNLGIMFKNMKSFDRSKEAYALALVFADSLDFGRAKLGLHTNLGILNVEMGQFENALPHIDEGIRLSEKYQARESLADNLNWLARAQIGLKEYDKALINANQSLIIGREVSSLEKQRDANFTLSEIYSAQHRYDQSLNYFKTYVTFKDSILNTERSKQISELQTLYETEKKDKEIKLLAQQTELDRTRKTRLWIGLGLSFLTGISLLYGQWIRYHRDRKIMAQENEIESQRRKNSELENEKLNRELDFKKQELVAKALQLARKNEFLQTVRENVDHLRQQVSGDAVETVRKLSRNIDQDIESENDWEQFLISFREVHRDFMDQLQEKYDGLTKSEIRLACLMKMNLSAKEQATLLNVTPDGIKKARYRLRKTLNLDSEVDIQEFFLGFPHSSHT